ncbi:sensor domain-containing diguanylate cyclase [Vibrio sp. MarTm2]|uniref:sensor domain-containing diguanylate cyclase n=1 Tax=Vibrio sp. MarTm2 TaxID=2998831 RepID=UPI0022CDB49F|nr:sensor domain-containing diguanylate cyclase [Vibrio sp. MarTm2]MDA0127780.1 sensor domain-containing diguanylate cyclase [Vibrio sp. MarTm2]
MRFSAPLLKMTIKQMLIVSHLVLVVMIVLGMSYARYSSEWDRQVRYSALLAKHSLDTQVNFFSGSVAGVNYANLTMSSTKQVISSIEDILFFEVKGVSDYSKRNVHVRYLAERDLLWRNDVEAQELITAARRIEILEQRLADSANSSPVTVKKLNYLLKRNKTEYDSLLRSKELSETIRLAWDKPKYQGLRYYLDQERCALHIEVPLTNANGGYIWAVIDASNLTKIRTHLIKELVLEASVALLISLLLIGWVTHWIVSPMKNLARSMDSENAYQEIDSLVELKRSDEIGQLARAYKGLLVKIENQLNILRTKSDTDPLTGLGSRNKYTRMVQPFIKRYLSKDYYVGMIVCDVDNFKAFNDLYGHTEGDNALAKVGSKIAELVRDTDLAFRYGGEEFVILCARPSGSQLDYFTERLRLEIEGLAILHGGNDPHRVITVSAGGARVRAFKPTSETDYEALQDQLFNAADKSLYLSKEQGRNCVNWKSIDA